MSKSNNKGGDIRGLASRIFPPLYVKEKTESRGNMNVLEIKKEVQKIKEKTEKEITELQSQITATEEKRAQLLKGMAENLETGKADAYLQNSQELNKVNLTIDYLTNRLLRLRTEPQISQENYESFTAAIYEELDGQTEKATAEIKKIIEEAKNKISAINSNISEANDLLKELQIDIYKDRTIRTANGSVIWPLIKSYKGYLSLNQFARNN